MLAFYVDFCIDRIVPNSDAHVGLRIYVGQRGEFDFQHCYINVRSPCVIDELQLRDRHTRSSKNLFDSNDLLLKEPMASKCTVIEFNF